LPADSNVVYITQPKSNIEILKKEACSPTPPGIAVDSIWIEKDPKKEIQFQIQ
jgi:hypothetical protein